MRSEKRYLISFTVMNRRVSSNVYKSLMLGLSCVGWVGRIYLFSGCARVRKCFVFCLIKGKVLTLSRFTTLFSCVEYRPARRKSWGVPLPREAENCEGAGGGGVLLEGVGSGPTENARVH